jgi:putative two-component system response regulator
MRHVPQRRLLTGDDAEQLARLRREVTERTEELSRSRDATIRRLAATIDLRDDATGGHSARTGDHAYTIARHLGMPARQRDLLRLATPLHDIGKIALPDRILHKPGPLTPAERRTVETHTVTGYRMLVGSGDELLDLAAMIAWTHHELIDGTGYPRGRVGSEIPEAGRIAAVADVADALMSERPYRPAYTGEQTLALRTQWRGRHLDADAVDALLAELRNDARDF